MANGKIWECFTADIFGFQLVTIIIEIPFRTENSLGTIDTTTSSKNLYLGLVGDSSRRLLSIPNSEAGYRDDLYVNDEGNYSNTVPGEKTTVLTVQKGFSGEITWLFEYKDLFDKEFQKMETSK